MRVQLIDGRSYGVVKVFECNPCGYMTTCYKLDNGSSIMRSQVIRVIRDLPRSKQKLKKLL